MTDQTNLNIIFNINTLDRNLKRTRTQNNPAQYGPVMLDWDGAESAYKRFFSVIKEEVGASFAVELTGKKLLPKHLQDDAVENENEEDPDVVEEGDILFGSDEEKAMCSAAEKVFGRGKFFRCTLHIEKNIKRHLRRTSTKKMNDIVYRWVHAPNAVTKAMSKADFEKAVLEIDQTVFDPRFFKKLVCTTWTYIVWPRLETKCIPFNWKNNMTEALNRVIKLYIDWCPKCLIEIIDIFSRLFTKQYFDFVQAIYGDSDLEFEPWMAHFRMGRDKFENLKGPKEAHLMVGKKQKEHIDKALRGPTKKETTCVSNDGNLSFDPKWANIKKKPGKLI